MNSRSFERTFRNNARHAASSDPAALRELVGRTAPLAGPRAELKALAIAVVLLLGLAVDAHTDLVGQFVVSAVVWTLWAVLLHAETPPWRRALVRATAFAMCAELFFSLGLGFYDYRFHNVPAFVPPGHVLLFMLGPTLARRLPDLITVLVPAAAVAYALWAFVAGWSQFEVLLAAMFLVAYGYGRSRKLYATMLVLALLLELWGTWLGNWRWQPVLPHLELVTTNPPILAGAFYALFDMYVMRAARRVHARTPAVAAAPA